MSDNSELVTANLSRVFDVYRSAGILDEGEILENIAFFALLWHFDKLESLNLNLDVNPSFHEKRIREDLIRRYLDGLLIAREFGNIDGNLLPKATSSLKSNELRHVAELLKDIFTSVDNLGKWFDQDLIPRLSAMSKGGRYATPRHLVRFMAGVTGVNPNDSLADFACGTGGMLVSNGLVQQATGIEISPNMVRLAFTNLVLHGQTQHDLYLGNTFELAGNDDKFRKAKFDVILMNPPFGMSVDSFMIVQAFGGRITGKSETLFASLAYEKLKPGGRMAVLVPSGVLFSNGSGETILREMLVEDGALRAVISLPRDSMQPINTLQTHILFAVKPKNDSAQNDVVWFYRPRYDGFTIGRNRKLDEKNDLPLIQAACNVPITQKGIVITPLMESDEALGYRIESAPNTIFQVKSLGRGYLVETFEQSIPTEIFYAEKENVYRGSSIPQDIPLGAVDKVGLKGEYILSNLFEDFLDETPTCSLKLEKGRGEIRKGSLGKARFGTQTKDEFEAIGVLLNDVNKVVSKPFPLIVDKLGKYEKPTGFTLSESADGKPAAQLLIFYEGVKGYKLSGSKDEVIYLCESGSNNGLGIFFYPASDKFGWTITLMIDTGGKILFQRTDVFKSDQSRNGVVFDTSGAVLGIGVHRGEILDSKGVELQGEKYWEEQKQVIETRSAAQILGDIKRHQNKLTSTLDRLLSISETQAVASAELPPRVQVITPSQDLVQGIQQSVWEIILQQVEPAGDYSTPTAFQADDIHLKLTDRASVMDVQRTLELFERMGLIVSVTYEGVPYYRLPTERDILTEAGK